MSNDSPFKPAARKQDPELAALLRHPSGGPDSQEDILDWLEPVEQQNRSNFPRTEGE